jgi:hypothetical protein
MKPLLKRLQALERKPYVGVVVKLAGLVGGAEHNGKLAFVLRALPQKERFELELIESGKRMDVRPANFVSFRLPEGTQVVTGAPRTGGVKVVCDLPEHLLTAYPPSVRF